MCNPLKYVALVTHTGGDATQKVLCNTLGNGTFSGNVLTIPNGFPLDRTVYNSNLTRVTVNTMQVVSGTDLPIMIEVFDELVVLAPNTFTATPGNNEIQLNWSAVAGVDGYKLLFGVDGFYQEFYNGSDLTYTLTGLLENTDYFFQLIAYKDGQADSKPKELMVTTIAQ